MTVTVEIDVIVVVVFPRWEMVAPNVEPTIFQENFVADKLPTNRLADSLIVVISSNKNLGTIQPTQNVFVISSRGKCEITNVIDHIILTNNRIPFLDQNLVHLFTSFEWTIAV